MPTNPRPFLRLTDGADMVTIQGGSSGGDYRLAVGGWVPNVAARRMSDLGGFGPFEDVVEEITIHVEGDDAADMYANLDKIIRLLDKADLWARDETLVTAPILIQYAPEGSTIATPAAPYEALILGRAPGDESLRPITLPPMYSRAGSYVFAAEVKIAFRRRGAWLAAAESGVASAAVGTGALWSVTLATHDENSPVDLSFNLPTTSNAAHAYYLDGVGVVMSDDTIAVYDSASMSAGGQWAASADTNAVGGSVVRLTPLAANTFYALGLNIPSTLQTAGQYLVLASMRGIPSFIERNWSIYLQYLHRTYPVTLTTNDTEKTPVVTFRPGYDGMDSYAQMVPLGVISIVEADDLALLHLYAAVDSLTSSPTLDIDYLVLAKITPNLTVAQFKAGTISTTYFSTSGTMVADIQQRRNSHRTPEVRIRRTNATARTVAMGYEGGLATSQRGTLYNGIIVGGSHNAGGNAAPYRWTQQPPAAANTLHTTAFTVTRRRAFRIPE